MTKKNNEIVVLLISLATTAVIGMGLLLLAMSNFKLNSIFVTDPKHNSIEADFWKKVALALTLKGHTGEVNSVTISPDAQTLVSGSDDKTIKIWNVFP